MLSHPTISILWVVADVDARHLPFRDYLGTLPHIQQACRPRLPGDIDLYDVVVTSVKHYEHEWIERLSDFAGRRGHGWLACAASDQEDLSNAIGARPVPLEPAAELRLLFTDHDTPLAARLPDAVYAEGILDTLEATSDHTESLVYADWRYRHRSVITRRPVADGWVAATTLQSVDHPVIHQVLHRLVRQLAGHPMQGAAVGAALLGYAPSVGRMHGLGIGETVGLTLRGVCDLDPLRRSQALEDFPGVALHKQAESIAQDPSVELVVVATPPNTHATLSRQMITAGKHVVCEKPLAMNVGEADAMAALAGEQQRLLCCHQNRRFDADFLAIRQALADGLIGELFYLETFVGGFDHPCGYWHSHAPICGGTTYDWGAHYLDWIVALMPQSVQAVRCTRHKRVWHDVTNADQERIAIRFANGAEAEFMHSDIAAARKPKWYLLGTKGAIVGAWQNITVHQPDAVHYYDTYAVPATEMTPALAAHRRDGAGRLFEQQLPAPRTQPYAFHRNLADHIHLGEPLAAPLIDSMRVVALLEAAARSAANGGSLEVPNG